MFVILAMLFTFTTSAQALDQHSHAGHPRLTAIDQTNLNHAALDAYIQFFNSRVHNGRDLEVLLGSHVKDSKEFKKLIEHAGPAPRLSRDGDDLVLEFGANKVHIRWPNLAIPQVYIEGVSFAFDPTAPFAPQVENLRLRLKTAYEKTQSTGMIDLFLPRAHAVVPIALAWLAESCATSGACMFVAATIGGAVFSQTAGEAAYTSACYLRDLVIPTWFQVYCAQYKDRRDAAMKQALNGLIPMAPKDPNLRWTPDKDLQCPQKGSDGVFQSWMAPVHLSPNGTWVPEPWFRFSATLKDGKFTEAYVYDNPTKKDDPRSADVQVFFNKNPLMKDHAEIESIKFRRANYTGKATDTAYETILATDTREAVPIPYRDRVIKMANLIESAQAWAQTCQNMAFMSKYGGHENATEVSNAMQQQPVVTPPPTTAPTSK